MEEASEQELRKLQDDRERKGSERVIVNARRQILWISSSASGEKNADAVRVEKKGKNLLRDSRNGVGFYNRGGGNSASRKRFPGCGRI